MSDDECWLCDSKDIAYTDALGMHWCEDHFRDYYLEGL